MVSIVIVLRSLICYLLSAEMRLYISHTICSVKPKNYGILEFAPKLFSRHAYLRLRERLNLNAQSKII